MFKVLNLISPTKFAFMTLLNNDFLFHVYYCYYYYIQMSIDRITDNIQQSTLVLATTGFSLS